MTQSFDEWLKTKKIGTDKRGVDYVNGFARAAHYGWLARQAEVDSLHKNIDALHVENERIQKEYQMMFECVQGRQQTIDELQKRIDLCERLRDSQFEKLWALTQAIEVARNDADEDFDLFLNYLSSILKGESNE